jgi:phospholipase/carboxylesterase
MTEKALTRTVEIDGWVVRQRVPVGDSPHALFLMLHGWTGDEDSMWVFAARLPKDAWLVAPRGLYKAPIGGYGWHTHKSKVWPWVDDFYPALESLQSLLTPENFPLADLTNLRLVGFSQGAALAYAYALSFPGRVHSLAGLSGFLPDGAHVLAHDLPLRDKPVFIAHGTEDELVPVERARQAVDLLNQAGARVSYCEDNVGHKLSADCFRGMQAFFERY